MNKDEFSLLIADTCLGVDNKLQDLKEFLQEQNNGEIPYGCKKNFEKMQKLFNDLTKLGEKIEPEFYTEEKATQLMELKDRIF
ncbi:hypothetical protein DY052_06090 [Apilactobacillus timberlakei]|uniref:hypothetical protein n=1 Tax=Apilactobacillus timberlakei TaxID=2008380 RepID=UPI00112ED5F3|nr:hypothetical protein [Apilactobacillus timberlakei]TPR14994.1 hypothetical protein DY052_06090 [Apilactobacillus timberlakei]